LENKKKPLLVARCLLVRRCFKQIAADHGQLATDRGLEDNPDKPEFKIEDNENIPIQFFCHKMHKKNL